jgi:hypothetical protein
VDPHNADPDPAFHLNADPDPGQSLKSQKDKFHMKIYRTYFTIVTNEKQ